MALRRQPPPSNPFPRKIQHHQYHSSHSSGTCRGPGTGLGAHHGHGRGKPFTDSAREAVTAQALGRGEPCLAQMAFQWVPFLNLGLSDATAPALGPRAAVFKLYSTEPSGFPQVLLAAVD